MRVSEQWLREWVDPKATTSEVASALTMMGLEVDETLPAADDFTGVCVGWVRQVEQHPNADRLRCCLVDVGQFCIDSRISFRTTLKHSLAT